MNRHRIVRGWSAVARCVAAGALGIAIVAGSAGCDKIVRTDPSEQEEKSSFTSTDPARDQYLSVTVDAPPDAVVAALMGDVSDTFPVYDAITKKLDRGGMIVEEVNETPAPEPDAAEAPSAEGDSGESEAEAASSDEPAPEAAEPSAAGDDDALIYEAGGPYADGVCIFGVTTAYENRWGITAEEMYAVRFSVRIEPTDDGGSKIGVKSVRAKILTGVSKGMSLRGDEEPTPEFEDVEPWHEANVRFLHAIRKAVK